MDKGVAQGCPDRKPLDAFIRFCYLVRLMRAKLSSASLIVLKLGTGILTDRRNRLAQGRVRQLVGQVARARKAGHEVVVVSSGAVGAGMEGLGLSSMPTRLEELQACAAVGQSRLMAAYQELFAQAGLAVGQVLLTHDDLQHHERHLNARNTIMALLDRGIVPIINENDAVSFTELTVGDNDQLSALVAALLPADLLVLLTTAEGVVRNFGKAGAKVISTVRKIDDSVRRHARGTQSQTSIGGMVSKINAADVAVRSGIRAHSAVCCGKFWLATMWARFLCRHPKSSRVVNGGLRSFIIQKERWWWMPAQERHCASGARVCYCPALCVARGNLRGERW